MTKKHFSLIANILVSGKKLGYIDNKNLNNLIHLSCIILGANFKNFDQGKFRRYIEKRLTE